MVEAVRGDVYGARGDGSFQLQALHGVLHFEQT